MDALSIRPSAEGGLGPFDPTGPSLVDGLLVSLWSLFTTPGVLLLLLPIIIGLLYPRRFIAVWHFITLLVVIPVVAVSVYHLGWGSSIYKIDLSLVFQIILQSFIYASLFTILAYVSSTIGTTFSKRIYGIQKVFNRLSKKTNTVLIVITYAIAFEPLIMLYDPYFYYFDYSMMDSLWQVISVALVFIVLLLVLAPLLYKRGQSFPARDFVKKRSDNHYLAAILLVLVVSLILGYVLYPGVTLG